MKKVLLAGEFSDVLRSVNECLEDDYQVQLCQFQVDSISGMIQMKRPDLIILCKIGFEEVDLAVFDWLNRQRGELTPVLVVTTEESWASMKDFCVGDRYDKLFRPLTKQILLGKCRQILGYDEPEERVAKPVVFKPHVRKKILVVDDSSLILRNIKGMLEKEYDIILANSGKKGIEMFTKRHPDLILMDYMMPGMDGCETFEAIRDMEDGADVPVVFLTCVSEKERIYSVLRYRPSGYVLKPPDRDKLMQTIEETLRESLYTSKKSEYNP